MSRTTADQRGGLSRASLALVFLAAACGLPAHALPTFDYANYQPYEARIPALTSTVGFGAWGHFAVLVDANCTVQVYDISAVTQPQLVYSQAVWYIARVEHVEMSGRLLLVSGTDNSGDPTETIVYEIQDNGALRLISMGFLREPGGHYYGPRGFATWGDLYFIGGYRDFGVYPNIFVNRVTSGYSSFVALVQGPGWPVAMAMKDNRLFVSSEDVGIAWFDFSPNGAITASGNLGIGINCGALDVAGDLLVAVEPNGTLDLVDAAAIGGPLAISRTALGGTPVAVRMHDKALLIADRYLGVRRVDIADRAAPVVLDTLYATAGATAAVGAGPYVLAASRRDGVEVIDPEVEYAHPMQFSVPWITGAFARCGPFVFGAGVVGGRKCAVLADVSDPGHPRLVGSSNLEWMTDAWVTMSDSLAVIGYPYCCGETGSMLYRWDAARGLIGAVELGGVLSSGAIRGTTVYLSVRNGYSGGGTIFSLDASQFPVLRSFPQLQLDTQPIDLAINGSVLWCDGWRPGGGSALCAYDITDRSLPVLRGRTDLPNEIYGISVEGDVLCSWGFSYVSDGAMLYDISRPNDIRVLSKLPPFGGVMSAELDQAHAYLGTREGLAIIDIEDPRAPVLVGAAAGPLPHLALGDNAILASGAGGLIGLAKPTTSSVAAVPAARPGGPDLAVSPNPFNPRASVSVNLELGGPVTLEVFDMRGRRIASLLRCNADAGTISAEWNGLDDAGAPVPSGSYIIRAVAPGGVATRKVMMVR